MINIDNVDICYKATNEVLEYFFDDSKEVAGILKLDGRVSPAASTIYALLIKHAGFKSKQDFSTLASKNFCSKALTLLPQLFEVSEEEVKTQVENIMERARAYIDGLGTGMLGYGAQTVKYASVERSKLIGTLSRRFSRQSAEDFEQESAKRHTQSKQAQDILSFCEENAGNRKVKTSLLKDKIAQFDLIELNEAQEIAVDHENRACLSEMEKIVIDDKAFTYKGVLLAPSVVKMHGANSELFGSGSFKLKDEYIYSLKEVSNYGLKAIISPEDCV